jgi:hypothetical protein
LQFLLTLQQTLVRETQFLRDKIARPPSNLREKRGSSEQKGALGIRRLDRRSMNRTPNAAG